MRNPTYKLAIFVGLLLACNSTGSRIGSSPTSRLVPEPDIVDRLTGQKQIIDTLFKHSEDKLIVLAKLIDKDEPITIENGNFPDSVETTFNILKDSLGHVLTVSEFPYSESGDWSIALTHYFDKTGRTFAFERQTNFFNSFCTEGPAYETETKFYDDDLNLIDEAYRLVDDKGNALQKDSCQFPYNYEYKVSPDVRHYLEANKIKGR